MHEEDLSQLANQPEASDAYQRAIKQTVRQPFVAGLHSNIKAQISYKAWTPRRSFSPLQRRSKPPYDPKTQHQH